MLIHPTIDKLNRMRLAGMAKGLRRRTPKSITFPSRIGWP